MHRLQFDVSGFLSPMKRKKYNPHKLSQSLEQRASLNAERDKFPDFMFAVQNLGADGVQLSLNGHLQAEGYTVPKEKFLKQNAYFWTIEIGIAWRMADGSERFWGHTYHTNFRAVLVSPQMEEIIANGFQAVVEQAQAEHGVRPEDMLTTYYYALPVRKAFPSDDNLYARLASVGTFEKLKTPYEMKALLTVGLQELAQIDPLEVCQHPQEKALWTMLKKQGIHHFGDLRHHILTQGKNLKGLGKKREDLFFESYNRLMNEHGHRCKTMYEFEHHYNFQLAVEQERQLRAMRD